MRSPNEGRAPPVCSTVGPVCVFAGSKGGVSREVRAVETLGLRADADKSEAGARDEAEGCCLSGPGAPRSAAGAATAWSSKDPLRGRCLRSFALSLMPGQDAPIGKKPVIVKTSYKFMGNKELISGWTSRFSPLFPQIRCGRKHREIRLHFRKGGISKRRVNVFPVGNQDSKDTCDRRKR